MPENSIFPAQILTAIRMGIDFSEFFVKRISTSLETGIDGND